MLSIKGCSFPEGLRRTLRTYSKGAPFYTASAYRHVGLDWRNDATTKRNPYFFWVPSQTLQNRCPQRSQTAVNFRVRFLHLQHFRLTESSIRRCSVYHRQISRSQFPRTAFLRRDPQSQLRSHLRSDVQLSGTDSTGQNSGAGCATSMPT